MKIKFNWGTGIILAIVIMVLFIGSLVYVTTQQEFSLVEDNYYEKGVKYQEQIEKRFNTHQLSGQLTVTQRINKIDLFFPGEFEDDSITGTVHFYSPVNKSFDFKTQLNTGENLQQTIETTELNKGRYILKIDWQSASKSYYHEQNLNIR